ncbi:unnamed protein product [Arctia plantaginis]|uniref:Uncharacterized protein n=1 Tax=Arctia plantaginis TaxID=874455 RepID=A0A8S0YW56_ARCPL|nr:unnamed protein product [Arctia plantaginis]CAB3247990.1 unnamed protein product [Arctia plantaginis]
MMGIRNSVSSRFRQSCPGIVIIKCICHSLHLCASDAAKEIPSECEQLARDVYNHFKSSSKRQSQFKAFQNFVEVDVHKILRPAQTRWLSLSSVVDRLLEQWDALRLYFDSKWLDDRECREIHKRLNDPIIKAYYYFLSWMLPKFANANAYFQSESTVITEMHTKMRDLYRNLIKLVMQPECMLDDKLIDPTNENLYLNLDDIYLGLGVRKQLSLPEVANNENDIREFRSKCRKFILRAIIGIRKRYSLDDELLHAVSTISSEACLSLLSHERPSTLAPLFTMLPRIAPKSLQEQQDLDDQWRCLPSYKQNTLQSLQIYFGIRLPNYKTKMEKNHFQPCPTSCCKFYAYHTLLRKSFHPNKRHQNRQEE